MINPETEAQAARDMAPDVRAAYAISLLLQLKQHIKASYRLDSERIANFTPFGEKRKGEERVACSKAKGPSLSLLPVPCAAFSSLERAAEVYTQFKALMSDDAADYGEGIQHNLSRKARRTIEAMNDEDDPPPSTAKKRGRQSKGSAA